MCFLLAFLALVSFRVAADESDASYQNSAVSYVSTFENLTSKTQSSLLLSDTLTDSLNNTFYPSVPALSLDWDEPESSTTIDRQNIIPAENGSLQREPVTLMDYHTDTKNKSSQASAPNSRGAVSYFKDTSTSAKDKNANQKALQLL